MLYLTSFNVQTNQYTLISEREEYNKVSIVSDLVDFCKSGDKYIDNEYIPLIADKLVEDRRLYSGWVALWNYVFGIYEEKMN